MLLNIKTDFDLIRLLKHKKIQIYATEPFREDQFIYTAENTIFQIHVNTDNDNSFSLLLSFKCIDTDNQCLQYFILSMDFTYRVPLYIYNMSCVLFYQ